MRHVLIQIDDPSSHAARELIERLDKLMTGLYPAESNHLLPVDALLQPDVTFLTASVDGEVAGCGAFVNQSGEYAEIKRMFVRPSARGSGIARALLDRLLNDARSEGYTRVRLETMSFMTEAHALYQSVGARAIDPFDGSEAGNVGLAGATTYLELPL